jgi:hypothetical protein
MSLRELGLPQSALRGVAEEVVARGTHNPRPITVDNILALLAGAWEGRRPAPVFAEDKPHNTIAYLKKKTEGGSHVGSAAE